MTKPAMAPAGKPVPLGFVALAVFALVLLLQLPLALNPGYFSHDELQWAVIAAQGGAFDWHAVQTFQYRPLTFTLWIWLSRALVSSSTNACSCWKRVRRLTTASRPTDG